MDKTKFISDIIKSCQFSILVVDDLIKVVAYMPPSTKMPELEDDEGTLTLEWSNNDNDKRFALHFAGTGNVVGTYVTLDCKDQDSWRYSVDKVGSIVYKLRDTRVLSLMRSREEYENNNNSGPR